MCYGPSVVPLVPFPATCRYSGGAGSVPVGAACGEHAAVGRGGEARVHPGDGEVGDSGPAVVDGVVQLGGRVQPDKWANPGTEMRAWILICRPPHWPRYQPPTMD